MKGGRASECRSFDLRRPGGKDLEIGGVGGGKRKYIIARHWSGQSCSGELRGGKKFSEEESLSSPVPGKRGGCEISTASITRGGSRDVETDKGKSS